MKRIFVCFFSICVILSLNNKSSIYANGNLQTYTVKSGDTLFDIAFKHNISVSEFLKINNISNYETYNLKQGQKLQVPTSGKSESNLTSNRKTETYTVKSNDTLSQIAENHNMGLSELYSINGINQSHVLKVGEKIKVYARASSTSSSSSSSSSNNSNRKTETYTIKSGDTLSEIAEKQGMALSELYSINGINQSHVLKVGEKIKVYARASSTSSSSSSSSSNSNRKTETYTIKSGDTLSQIAERQGMALSELYSINGINQSHVLKVGEKIKVYARASSTSSSSSSSSSNSNSRKTETYTIKSGDTLSQIAERQGMALSELYSINGINQSHVLKVGEKIKVYARASSTSSSSSSSNNSSRKTETYTIKSGDTLSQIAERQGMALSELYSINGINQSHVLKVGEKIKVYSRASSTSSSSSSSSSNKTITEKHVVTYVVKSGDSLLQIALKENMSFTDLCKLNNIQNPDKHTLKVGDKIKVEKVITKTNTTISTIQYPKVDFAWPYKGSITETYGKNDKAIGNKGINISGKVGDNIYATLDGKVDFVGKIRGFGDVVIVKHKNDYNTIYAHLSESKLKAGDNISKNDIIGKIGDSGFTDKNELHFKVFYKGQPVDPMKILPKK